MFPSPPSGLAIHTDKILTQKAALLILLHEGLVTFNSMHVKGGWVRQTIALTKCNDSGGMKLRIRRSKEERKAMVESFIKKIGCPSSRLGPYQELNNGDFPPLSLTYKEVGGSYYIVREVFRKIIQENRVLGPAKFMPKEQSPDRFFKQHQLGSVFIEPETDSLLSNKSRVVTHILRSHHQGTSEELVLNSSVQCPEPEHERFDEWKIINGYSQAVEKNEEYDKAVYRESQARESLELEENVVELQGSKVEVTHVAADTMVETLPLTSGSRITCGLDEKSIEHSEVTGTLVEEIEKLEMETGNNSVVGKLNIPESSCDLGNKKDEAILAGSLLENSNGSTTKESSTLGTNDGTDPEVKYASPAGIRMPPESILDLNLNDTNSSSSSEKSISAKAIDGQNNSNIESWETSSEKSAKPEMNPLSAFFKSSVAAFVEFWSK
ncbi:hypothetical protein HYC85_000564 [Camellia sinensis]|uniref:AT3G52170-like helix-turn-helix domain-containing protein n=1 Tax=Camellia sinensis TaxID=4442 RepID=A0A7J7I3N0_CAMSI|nr:hypothetical protein HYC85_000564 [Camellia sinensis]